MPVENIAFYLQHREFGGKTKKQQNQKISQKYVEDLIANPVTNQPCALSGYCRSTFLMEFSPDGTKVASTHGDHTVRVTDLATGHCIRTLKGHPRTPWCLAFHPSSSHILASGCLGGEVRIWDLYGPGCEVWQVKSNVPIASLTFHPTDNVLVFAVGCTLYFWDWSKAEPFAYCETQHPFERIRWVHFDPHGHYLFTGIANNTTGQHEQTAPVGFINSSEQQIPASRRVRSQRLSVVYNNLIHCFQDYRRDRLINQVSADSSRELNGGPSWSGADPSAHNDLEGPENSLHPDVLAAPRSPVHEEGLRFARQYASHVTQTIAPRIQNARNFADAITREAQLPRHAMTREVQLSRRTTSIHPYYSRYFPSQDRLEERDGNQFRSVIASFPIYLIPNSSHTAVQVAIPLERTRVFNSVFSTGLHLSNAGCSTASSRSGLSLESGTPVRPTVEQQQFSESHQTTSSCPSRVQSDLSQLTQGADSFPVDVIPGNSGTWSNMLLPQLDPTNCQRPSRNYPVNTMPCESCGSVAPNITLDTTDNSCSAQPSGASMTWSSDASNTEPLTQIGNTTCTESVQNANATNVSVNWTSSEMGSTSSLASTPSPILAGFLQSAQLPNSATSVSDSRAVGASSIRFMSIRDRLLSANIVSGASSENDSCRSNSDTCSGTSAVTNTSFIDQSCQMRPVRILASCNTLGHPSCSHCPNNTASIASNMSVTNGSFTSHVPQPLENIYSSNTILGAASGPTRGSIISTSVQPTPVSTQSSYCQFSGMENTSLHSLRTRNVRGLHTDNSKIAVRSNKHFRDRSPLSRSESSVIDMVSIVTRDERSPLLRSGTSTGDALASLPPEHSLQQDQSSTESQSGLASSAREVAAGIGNGSESVNQLLPGGEISLTDRRSILRQLGYHLSVQSVKSAETVHSQVSHSGTQSNSVTQDVTRTENRSKTDTVQPLAFSHDERANRPVNLNPDACSGAFFTPISEENSSRSNSIITSESSLSHAAKQLSAESQDTLDDLSINSSSDSQQNLEIIISGTRTTLLTADQQNLVNIGRTSNAQYGVNASDIRHGNQDSNNNTLHSVHPGHSHPTSEEYEAIRENYLSITDRIEREMNSLNERINQLRENFNSSLAALRRDRERYANLGRELNRQTGASVLEFCQPSRFLSENPPLSRQQRVGPFFVNRSFHLNPSGLSQPRTLLEASLRSHTLNRRLQQASGRPLEFLEMPEHSDVPVEPHTWRALQRQYLHPHYSSSILDDTINRPNNAIQSAINRAIAGAFMGTGEGLAVASNIMNQTHRIQCWDFRRCAIPDITDAKSNIVVPHCKIHNDASCDISKDGSLLATFVPSHQGFPDDNILAVYSLNASNKGQCLFTKSFGPNAISTSLSPGNDYVMVGLAAKRLSWVFTANQLVAQVYKLDKRFGGESSMKHVTDILHPCDMDIRTHVSVNSAKWLPEPGQGLVYGTNRGDLHICRPWVKKIEKAGEVPQEKIIPNAFNPDRSSIRRNLRQVLGLSNAPFPRTISIATQTHLRNVRRSAGTQTDNSDSD
ncbi:hypothetical protein CHS0354_033705 [Potamilus streckersoni]|nr:hypothetical protein CHS0354_033705 [Potamilus streckersoni]